MSTKKANRNKVSLRECISCGEKKPKGEMMRIVITHSESGDTERSLDETGRVKGRGAYLCRDPKCIEAAAEKKLISEEEKEGLETSMKQHALSMLSIAAKAGKVFSGELQCEAAIKDGKAVLVILSEDASPNTTKKFSNKCSFYELPLIRYGEKEELGRLIGREARSVIAITDEGLAAQISRALTIDSNDSEV